MATSERQIFESLNFLDGIAENGEPGQRKALNTILTGMGARRAAETLRALVQVQTACSELEDAVKSWREGAEIIEECAWRARRADPSDAPFPLDKDSAALWHHAQAAAYVLALEMMSPPGHKPEPK